MLSRYVVGVHGMCKAGVCGRCKAGVWYVQGMWVVGVRQVHRRC